MSSAEASPGVFGRMVRPYTMTGGRAGIESPPLALEAQVRSTSKGMSMRPFLQHELAEILRLAEQETAVIELAAFMDVPIGVVRVLATDLQRREAVTIVEPPSVSERSADEHTDLLTKVLDGIKSL